MHALIYECVGVKPADSEATNFPTWWMVHSSGCCHY